MTEQLVARPATDTDVHEMSHLGGATAKAQTASTGLAAEMGAR